MSFDTNLTQFVGEEITNKIQRLPTDLYSDEPPLESDAHRDQIDLLIRLLKYGWQDRNDFYISGNITIYYCEQQLKHRDFRGPDIFIVLGAEKRDRRSWAIWEEGGKYPNVVIELLSSATAAVDRGQKKELYLGLHDRQLRWFTDQGEIVPLAEEIERQAKEQAQARTRKLEDFLRSQGIDPDHLPE